MPVPTVNWVGGLDGKLEIIDQTLLPSEYRIIDLASVEDAWEAIKRLRVRGAPALGVTAGFAVVLGIRKWKGDDAQGLVKEVERVCEYVASSRPTAVNLFWALERMKRCAQANAFKSSDAMKGALLAEAKRILDEDKKICRRLGEHGATLIPDGARILTHCNAGGLATSEYGTALAAVFTAHEQGKRVQVYADETRPLLQGARLTTWELMQAGIETTLICDDMAAQVMKTRRVDMVITGADRIAANGDAANKIGTYGLAVLARHHGLAFYVVAPVSTFDMTLETGEGIPIEERSADEVTTWMGLPTAPEGVKVFNPAFDVTPHELISAIVTERGVITEPDAGRIAEALEDSHRGTESTENRNS